MLAEAPPPPPPPAYAYPIVAAGGAPGTRHKLSHSRMLLLAGGSIAILVIVITVIAVAVHPGIRTCGFFCGPHTGSRLTNPTAFTSSQFGYTIEYDSKKFTVVGKDGAGIQLAAAEGPAAYCSDANAIGEIDFSATSGTDVNGAIQNAENNLGNSGLVGMQPNGNVDGAEIGFVNGTGVFLSGRYEPSDGSGENAPASAVIIASTSYGFTITAVAWSETSSDVGVAPYGLCDANNMDAPLSNTIWPGQQ